MRQRSQITSLIKIISFIALILFSTYLFIHYDLYLYFINKGKAIGFINSFHPYDEVAFISLQILQVIIAIPGEVTGIIGGYLYGPLMGTIYSMIGLTIGSWFAFALARTFGFPLVRKTVDPGIIKKYGYVMEHHGILLSFVLFFIPGFPKDYLCYILGLSSIRPRVFLIISTIGRLFGTILLTVSGSLARNDQYKTLLMIAVVSSILIFVGYLYRNRLLFLIRKLK